MVINEAGKMTDAGFFKVSELFSLLIYVETFWLTEFSVTDESVLLGRGSWFDNFGVFLLIECIILSEQCFRVMACKNGKVT